LAAAALVAAIAPLTLGPVPATNAQEAGAALVRPTAPAPGAWWVGWWSRHGLGLTVQPDGTATADWRTYTWCEPRDLAAGVARDRIVNDVILNGGWAPMRFEATRTADGSLLGTVVNSTDRSTMPLGAIRLLRLPYGMGQLVRGGTSTQLAGPRFAEEAPDCFKATNPVGA
jgi:hypothetical protein